MKKTGGVKGQRKLKIAISPSTSNGSHKQKTILSFFEVPKKGKTDEIKDSTNLQNDGAVGREEAKPTTPPSKRAKLSNDNGSPSPSNSGSLTPEQKDLINSKAIGARLTRLSNVFPLLDTKMGITWFTALEDEFRKDYFKKLNDFVVASRNRGTVYPPASNVWEWTKQYPIQDVRVVILGQDPYHGPNQAHGLCFSVKKEIRPPPSLVNIYKELQTDIPGFEHPDHGCLNGWAQQGVLLLNAVLTVNQAQPNSHKDQGWENVTDAVIKWISKNLNSVVFLLWGSHAQKKAIVVDKKKHHLLQCPHPSPFSANKGFFGCKHFSQCNELLIKSGRAPIDWKHLP